MSNAPGVGPQRRLVDRLASALGALFRSARRMGAALLDAWWIVGQIPHAPPNLHELMRTDQEDEEISAGPHEDSRRR